MNAQIRLSRITESGLILQPISQGDGTLCGPLSSPIPLPQGDVFVTSANSVSGLIADLSNERFIVEVVDLSDTLLVRHEVNGRAGLNDLYESIIGYRPDDEGLACASELLHLVVEVAYRDATGDFA